MHVYLDTTLSPGANCFVIHWMTVFNGVLRVSNAQTICSPSDSIDGIVVSQRRRHVPESTSGNMSLARVLSYPFR